MTYLHSAIRAAFCASLGTVACAASDPGEAPGDSPAGDPFSCSSDAALELSSLADFESGVAEGFYTNNDGSAGSEADPPAGSNSPASTTIEGGRCGVSEQALRLTGSGFTDWGMVWGTNFETAPVDYSAWEGVSFWARRGDNSGTSLFFSVTDIKTDPVGGECLSEPELVYQECGADGLGVTDPTKECRSEVEILSEKCDAYGVGVGLEEQWRFFQIPFSSLRQRGFGVLSPAFDPTQIIGLGWSAGPGNWDVWIDDVSLYRSPVGTSSEN